MTESESASAADVRIVRCIMQLPLIVPEVVKATSPMTNGLHAATFQSVPPTLSVSTGRSLSDCTGRLLPWKSAVKAPICVADSAIGVVITNHCTPSLHGGVVSEPSYRYVVR